jgi:hypothetical protein
VLSLWLFRKLLRLLLVSGQLLLVAEFNSLSFASASALILSAAALPRSEFFLRPD